MRRCVLSGALVMAMAWAGSAQSVPLSYWITTVAGSDAFRDGSPALRGLLQSQSGMAFDRVGNLYISDCSAGRIRKVTPSPDLRQPSGTIVTFAGTVPGYAGDEGPATQARLYCPGRLAFDAAGNLFVVDGWERDRGFRDAAGNLFVSVGGLRIRKITPGGVITTFAGGDRQGFGGGDGGPAAAAQFQGISGIAIDAAGNVYVTDSCRIRRITTSGTVETFAGGVQCGTSGDGGPATAAQFQSPGDLAFDSAGDLYVATRSGSGGIRKISADGRVSTLPMPDPRLALSLAIAVGRRGELFVADNTFPSIFRLQPDGTFDNVTPALLEGTWIWVWGLATDAAGNLYVAISNYSILAFFADSNFKDYARVAGMNHWDEDGTPATAASLYSPSGLAIDRAGNMYFADSDNYRIGKVAPDGTLATVVSGFDPTYIGPPSYVAVDASGTLFFPFGGYIRTVGPSPFSSWMGDGRYVLSGDGGPASAAGLSAGPMAFDSAGNLFFADPYNRRIRKISRDGIIITVAGTGTSGAAGDGGPATGAQIGNPTSLLVDPAGAILMTDNCRVRKIGTDGIISTIFGTGIQGASRDGTDVRSSYFCPRAVAQDTKGNLFFTEWNRVVTVSASGIMRTLAGGALAGFAGDNGPGIRAQLYSPTGIAVDAAGNLYVADTGNHRIRKLAPNLPDNLAIVAGDRQNGAAGGCLPAPLKVVLRGNSGIAIPGAAVRFAATSGSATLTRSTAITSADGTAAAEATLGSSTGAIIVTASADGVPPVYFTLTASAEKGVEAARACITSGGVVGAAFSTPPVGLISPNSLVAILGQKFAPQGTARAVTAADMVNGQLPTRLAGVCVQAGNQSAPLLFVSPTQINIQVPSDIAIGQAPIRVLPNCASYDDRNSNTETVTVQPAAPELFTFTNNPDGNSPAAAILSTTGALAGVPGLLPGAVFTTPKNGDFVTLFVNGLGATKPAIAAGSLPGQPASTTQRVFVSMAGWELDQQDVLYAGGAPGFAGLYQVNIRVRERFMPGDCPVGVRVNGWSSPPGPYLTIR